MPCHAVLLTVDGMMCQNSCGSTVQNSLRSVPGVLYAEASFAHGTALVLVEEKRTNQEGEEEEERSPTDDDLLEAIDMVGFDASLRVSGSVYCHDLTIEGMMCQNSCGTTCTNALLSSSIDVITAKATFSDASAVAFTLHSSPTSPVDLAEEIEDVGFEANVVATRLVATADSADANLLMLLLKDAVEKRASKSKTGVSVSTAAASTTAASTAAASTAAASPSSSTNSSSAADATKGLCKMFFNVGGMSCASCSSSIERHVGQIDGVKEIKVALLAERAEVTMDTSVKGASQHVVIDTIRGLGFTCIPLRVELLLSRDNTGSSSSSSSSSSNNNNTQPSPYLNDTVRLRVGGMSCASCSSKIERNIGALEHVESVSIGLVTEQFVAVVSPGGPGVRDLVRAIEGLGFTATIEDDDDLGGGAAAMAASHQKTVGEWRRLFMFSLCFLLPMLLFQKVLVWIPFFNAWLTTHVVPKITWQTLIQMILATPVQIFVGKRFYVAAWRGLKHRNCGMDFLIAMGTTAAYSYSIISVLVACMVESFHGNHFFETSAMLLTFVVMGKLMEAHAKGKTSEALTKLMELQPKKAILVSSSEEERARSSPVDDLVESSTKKDKEKDKEQQRKISPSSTSFSDRSQQFLPFNPSAMDPSSTIVIPIGHVQVDDVLKVLPGASVPVDGTVVYGTSSCNEAMITGEAMPVEKSIGDQVFGGTINYHGVLFVRAVRIGGNTAISQIVRLVEDAQTTKAPIQKFADRVSGIFAPTVLVLSISTFFLWMLILGSGLAPAEWVQDAQQSGSNFVFSFLFGVAVLVIACPCALGLATPTAVMVGTGIGAKLGILIKGGLALETAHGVDTVLFDKTGTLTTGIPTYSRSVLRSAGLSGSSSGGGGGGGTENKRDGEGESSLDLMTNDEMCVLVGCSELSSEHPLSHALVCHAQSIVKEDAAAASSSYVLREPLDCEIIPGMGLIAHIDVERVLSMNSAFLLRKRREISLEMSRASMSSGNGGTGGSSSSTMGSVDSTSAPSNITLEVVVGNLRLMREREVEMFDSDVGSESNSERLMRDMELNGETAVCVAMDGVFVGVIGIADQIKEDAAETVEKMHEMGIDVYVVTGDSTTTAKAVAKSLRVPEDRVFSEVLPSDKANYVQSLQSRGRIVAMVGDGINDSPALAQANVGIALGSGSQIAMESADMVIVKNRLMDVLVAFDLSRSVFHRIRMNFVWAMGYNLVGIPIAAGILYPFLHVGLPPQFAGLAMAFSSVSVVLSSLHLKYYKTPREREEEDQKLGWCGWCLSIPGQLCSCCVDVIFADGIKIRSGVGAAIASNLSSSPSNRRRPNKQRGKYSKVNDEEDVDDWGDGGDFEMV